MASDFASLTRSTGADPMCDVVGETRPEVTRLNEFLCRFDTCMRKTVVHVKHFLAKVGWDIWTAVAFRCLTDDFE